MFYSPGLRRNFLIAASLLVAACNRGQGPSAPRKYAVLRFENLSRDGSLDWAGRALSETLGQELGAITFPAISRAQNPFSPHPASAPGISAEQSPARLLGAADIITGYFTSGEGKLHVTAVEEDAATRRIVGTLTVTGDVFSAADALAKRFTSRPHGVSTKNAAALRFYALGLEAKGAQASNDFEQATAADPNFGDAYLAWTRSAAATGDRAALDRALAAGLSRGATLQPLDRAHLTYDAATLRQDTPAVIDSLTTIVKLAPGNPGDVKALASAEMSAHRFAPASEHYRQALALAPEDVDLLNLQAYAKMFGGDEAGALTSIREYQKAKPQDANAVDSEGDIDLYFGRFQDAERLYLRAFAMSPSFDAGVDGWKAARARLMTGDIPGAEQLFRSFHDARAKAADPALAFRDAEWLYITGRRPEATSRMGAAAESSQSREVRALCLTQAAIWELVAGNRDQADKHAVLALQLGNSSSLVNAALVHFLRQTPASAAEWRSRAGAQINGGSAEPIRQIAIAYAWLLSRESARAVPAWKAISESGNPSDQTSVFLYARALMDAGQNAAAQPLVKTNPIPLPVPAATFECLYFPDLFNWRGDHETFTKLGSTPVPAK